MKKFLSLVLVVGCAMIYGCGGAVAPQTDTEQAEVAIANDFLSASCGPVCTQTADGQDCSHPAFCCTALDQCDVLTPAACQDYCAQQGLPVSGYACKTVFAVCSCCTQ